MAILKEEHSMIKVKYESTLKNLKRKLQGQNELEVALEENRNKYDDEICGWRMRVKSLEAELEVAKNSNKQIMAVRSQLIKDNSSNDEIINSLNVKLGIARSALKRSMNFEIDEDSKILPDTANFFNTIDKRLRTKHSKLREINSRIEYRLECTEKRLKGLRY